MTVSSYKARGKTRYCYLKWVNRLGVRFPLKGRGFETREAACMAEAEAISRESGPPVAAAEPKRSLTLAGAWEAYRPICERDCKAYGSDLGRAKRLLSYLGEVQCNELNVGHVEAYRRALLAKDKPLSPATLDRDLELLKRTLNAVRNMGLISENPIARAMLLRKPNVRKNVFGEIEFQRLSRHAESYLKPIILMAFDTGMRQREVLDLTWVQVDLQASTIRLWEENTKTQAARLVVMTPRVLEAIRGIPVGAAESPVFQNPSTRRPWQTIRKAWNSAANKAGLKGYWFHDLRRSFITRARRAGIPESVVMKMSGHKTRSVFDRYNVVDERDLRNAVSALANSI